MRATTRLCGLVARLGGGATVSCRSGRACDWVGREVGRGLSGGMGASVVRGGMSEGGGDVTGEDPGQWFGGEYCWDVGIEKKEVEIESSLERGLCVGIEVVERVRRRM